MNFQANSRKRLLQSMSTHFASRVDTIEPTQIFDTLLERERLGTTGMGHGVAIPHARLANLDEVLGSLYLLEQPIDFQSPDQQPVDIVFGLIVPVEANETHLQILATIAKLFDKSTTRAALRDISDAHSAFHLITELGG